MLLRPQFRLSFWFAILISFAAFFSACSSSEKIPDSAEGLFKHAQELEKDERFEEALARYQDVKNKHPYSRFATQSEMAIADIHFRREEYPEAQVAYQTFREFHPKHERIDYVTSQLGLSFFHQLPSTIDRDLTLAERAINYFDEVLLKYPKSEFAKCAAEKRAEYIKMLSEK
ncbi:MAG: outer membrane protein assembly factor BamD [Pseudobdellovibrionaceae bacterium]